MENPDAAMRSTPKIVYVILVSLKGGGGGEGC
jgi:hypothetical protein